MKLQASLAFFAGILLLAGCDASDPAAPTPPAEYTPPERLTPEDLRRSTVSGDSVYWIDNYMAFEDSTGVFWEFERTGSAGVYPTAMA